MLPPEKAFTIYWLIPFISLAFFGCFRRRYGKAILWAIVGASINLLAALIADAVGVAAITALYGHYTPPHTLLVKLSVEAAAAAVIGVFVWLAIAAPLTYAIHRVMFRDDIEPPLTAGETLGLLFLTNLVVYLLAVIGGEMYAAEVARGAHS